MLVFPHLQFLSLVLNAQNQEKNTKVSAASSLSSNDRVSAHFDDTYLKLSIQVRFHSMLTKYENSKN